MQLNQTKNINEMYLNESYISIIIAPNSRERKGEKKRRIDFIIKQILFRLMAVNRTIIE